MLKRDSLTTRAITHSPPASGSTRSARPHHTPSTSCVTGTVGSHGNSGAARCM